MKETLGDVYIEKGRNFIIYDVYAPNRILDGYSWCGTVESVYDFWENENVAEVDDDKYIVYMEKDANDLPMIR